MQITSPPATETLRVTDLDVRFPGETYSGTVYPGDTLTFTDQEIRVVFAKTGEEVTIQRARVLWWSRREREITRPPTKPAAASPATPTVTTSE